MEESLPKFHETFIPILDVLSSGQVIHYNELRKRVRDKYYSDLPDDLQNQKTKTGDPLILNRIGWGKAYLKQAGFLIQPERAMVQITDKGKERVKFAELTLKQLKNEPEYIEAENNKTKKIREPDKEQQLENSTPQDLIDQGINIIEEDAKLDLQVQEK